MSNYHSCVVRQTTFGQYIEFACYTLSSHGPYPADIPDTVQMTQAATVNDPLMQYLRDTPVSRYYAHD